MREILVHTELGREPTRVPVLWHVPNAAPQRRMDAAEGHPRSLDRDRSLARLDQADHRIRHRRRAGTTKTDQSDALAGADGKVDLVDRAAPRPDGELLDLELRSAKRTDLAHRLDLGRTTWGCASNHRRDEIPLADVADAAGQDELPVAQHADALTDLVDLLQVVRDIQNSDAAFSQAAHALKQAVHSRLLERRRRLLQNQETRPDRKPARDLDDLPLLASHGRRLLVDVAVEAPLEHQAAGLGPHPLPVHDRAPAFHRSVEEYVFGDREGRYDPRPLLAAGNPGEPRTAAGKARRCLARAADRPALRTVR